MYTEKKYLNLVFPVFLFVKNNFYFSQKSVCVTEYGQ